MASASSNGKKTFAQTIVDFFKGSKKSTTPTPAPTPTSKSEPRVRNYNTQSVLNLGMGPISTATVNKLVESGQVNAHAKNGQIYLTSSTPKTSKTSTVSLTKAPTAAPFSTADNGGALTRMGQAAQTTTTSSTKPQEGRSRPIEIPMRKEVWKSSEINQRGNAGTSARDYAAMANALEVEAKNLFKEYSALTTAPRRGATSNLTENRQEAARKLQECHEKLQEATRLREQAVAPIRQQLDSVTQRLKETREARGKLAGQTGYSYYARLQSNQLTEREHALESQRRTLTTKLKESGGELTTREKLANVGTGVSDFFNSVVSGGDSAWGGLFGTLAMVDEATGNAMNKIARTVTGNEKYDEPVISPFREYADYHNGQAADTLARASGGRGKLGQQVMETGQAIGNMLANSSLSGLTGGTGAGMGVTFGTSSAGLNASTAQKGITAVTNAAARLGNELLSNQTNALISANSAGHTYIDATNRGADQDKAMANAILAGLMEYESNKMFSGTPLEDTGEKGYVTKLIEYATDKIGKREALGTFLNSPLGKGASFVFDKIGEGLEEVITAIGDPLAERITWNPEADLATVDEIVDSFIGGLMLSLMMSGGEAVIDNTAKAGGRVANMIGNRAAETQKTVSAEVAAKAAQAVEELGAKPSEAQTVEETNRLPGYSEQDVARREQLRTAERIAWKFGAELEVAELPSGVDGKYRDGKIIISPRAKNPVMTVAVHELTHHMESSGRYGEFSRMILDYVSNEMGVDVDAMKNAIRSEYAKGGFALDDVGAERELVAKFAESKLFQDEAAINRLARTNRSMFQTVKDWISDMVVKLTGTEEEKFFRNAERLYEKALREVGDTANNNGWQARYSISSHLMDELMSVLDGTFNSFNNEVYIGKSSNFLTDVIGAKELKKTMPPNKAYSAMVTEEQAIQDGRYREGVNYHGLGPDGLMRVLEASENPVAAFADTSNGADSRANHIVLVTGETKAGSHIVVVEELETTGHLKGKRIDVNKTITTYDRSALSNDIAQAAFDQRLLHLDKKRSQDILAGALAANSRVAIQEADFEHNIQLFWDNVKWAKNGNGIYTTQSKLPTVTDTDRKMLKAFVEKAQRVEDSEKAYYADMIREIIRNASQKDTLYADELRKFLKGLNWFDEP